jgi:hypothetical protein
MTMHCTLSTSTAARSGPALAALAAFAVCLPAQQTNQDPLATARTTLEQWVETRRLTSQEKRDWVVGKESLTARIDVVKREIESLKKRITDAEGSIAEADKKRTELIAENEKKRQTEAKLIEQVVAMEARALRLLPRLPDPLRERVKPLSQRLPRAGEETKQSAGERWQNVVGILNEVHKWNREITVTSEVRTMGDGSSVEVAVFYIGVGQGFYAGANGKVAGVGAATAEGWQWRAANELAPDVLRAIAIFKNEQVAAFVRLPIQIL